MAADAGAHQIADRLQAVSRFPAGVADVLEFGAAVFAAIEPQNLAELQGRHRRVFAPDAFFRPLDNGLQRELAQTLHLDLLKERGGADAEASDAIRGFDVERDH